jgi:L-cysteine/cystine lyase
VNAERTGAPERDRPVADGWAAFRAQFPVLETYRYLNAGTEGPIPSAAAAVAQARITSDTRAGRIGKAYIEEVLDLAGRARAGYATALGGAPLETVALTESTTSGINTVLGGLTFARGDEIVTSDQEHPGLLAPLRRLQARHGVRVTVVPFDAVADAVGPHTKLVACSHVSWVGGEIADVSALVATGAPVLLDAAQALGAIPLDVTQLGVDFYAGSGQKWLCGPEGSGALYVRPDRLDDLEPPWPSYATVADHDNPLASALADGAGRLDSGFPPVLRSGWAVASMDVFEAAGWEWVHARAAFMATTLAEGLAERGLEVAARGASTLVAWKPRAGVEVDAEVARLRELGILVRSIPSHGLVRASCGAWTIEEDVTALVAAAA